MITRAFFQVRIRTCATFGWLRVKQEVAASFDPIQKQQKKKKEALLQQF